MGAISFSVRIKGEGKSIPAMRLPYLIQDIRPVDSHDMIQQEAQVILHIPFQD